MSLKVFSLTQPNLILLAILLIVVVLDYITGITNAYINSRVSSKVGFIGIIKKLSYFIIVIVSSCISYISNIDLVSVATVWLIVNDLISILENIKGMGVEVPGFLIKIIDKLKEENNNE